MIEMRHLNRGAAINRAQGIQHCEANLQLINHSASGNRGRSHAGDFNLRFTVAQNDTDMRTSGVEVVLASGQRNRPSGARRIKRNRCAVKHTVRLIDLVAISALVKAEWSNLEAGQASPDKHTRRKEGVSDEHDITRLRVGILVDVVIIKRQSVTVGVLRQRRNQSNRAVLNPEAAHLSVLNGDDVALVVREDEVNQLGLQRLGGVTSNAKVVDVAQAGALNHTTFSAHQNVFKPLSRGLVNGRVSAENRGIADLAKLEAVDWNANSLHQLRLCAINLEVFSLRVV